MNKNTPKLIIRAAIWTKWRYYKLSSESMGTAVLTQASLPLQCTATIFCSYS